jgi:hypothetical protein
MTATELILSQILTGLKTIDAEYTIKTKDGEVFSNMVQVEQKKKRSSPEFPMGTYSTFVRDQLPITLTNGDSGTLKLGSYKAGKIRSAFLQIVQREFPHLSAKTELIENFAIIWAVYLKQAGE